MHRTGWTRREILRGIAAFPAALAIGCHGGGSGAPGGDDHPGGDDGPDAGTDAGSTDPDAPEHEITHTCADTLPRLDLKVDCGAKGDGMTDDSPALRDAAKKLEAAGGGELVIPPGRYLVGKQLLKTDAGADPDGPYYQPVKIFSISGVSCLQISGYGATLEIADGLRFGGFDRDSGEPIDVDGRIQLDAAHVGRVFEIQDSTNVTIEGVEIDGNLGGLILGGQWGDIHRQTSATGLFFNRCSDVTVRDVHTHHHGLDGITVIHMVTSPTGPKPHRIENTVSEYNGRQGLSWIGGWGLTCTDCKFNHTGRALNNGTPLASNPRAGLDIEPNANGTDLTRDGLFTRCEFIDNAGPGMVTAGGDGAYATFVDCTFWGTTSYSIWAAHPGLAFEDCRFHGTALRGSDGSGSGSTPNAALATKFSGCTFEDVPWTDGRVYRNGALYSLPDSGESQGVTFTECAFINHGVRSVLARDPMTREEFHRCTFTFANNTLSSGTYQADFQGSRLVSCTFAESGLTRTYYISLASAIVGTPAAGDPPTHVNGPRVHWRTATGATNADIAPGTYSS